MTTISADPDGLSSGARCGAADGHGASGPARAGTRAKRPAAARAGAAGPALGTTEIKEQQVAASRELWRLQEVMWGVTRVSRLRGCHRWRAPGSSEATVQWSPAQARFGGLQNSYSVWASPVASARIGRLRAAELSRALDAWSARSTQHSVAFCTLTLAHSADQGLTEVWDTISAAWRGVTGTASWRGGPRTEGDVARFGIAHWVKAVEATHGQNGWHVHVHCLLLLERSLDEGELGKLRGRIYDRWSAAAVRRGFKAPTVERGVKLELAANSGDLGALAGYMTKGQLEGLSLANEITGGQVIKQAKIGNRTPFQVLADIGKAKAAGDDYARDLAIWGAWERESHGRRQMAWSKGAKDALGITDLDDQELLAEDDGQFMSEAWAVASIPAEQWAKISGNTAFRCDLIELLRYEETAEKAQATALRFLEDHGIYARPVMQRLYEPPEDDSVREPERGSESSGSPDERRASVRHVRRLIARRAAREVLTASGRR